MTDLVVLAGRYRCQEGGGYVHLLVIIIEEDRGPPTQYTAYYTSLAGEVGVLTVHTVLL